MGRWAGCQPGSPVCYGVSSRSPPVPRRDLAVVGRICFFALIVLIIFGIVLIFVHIPQGDLIY